MAEESNLLTCDEFTAKARSAWETFCAASDTADPEEWDKAFESYMDTMDELWQAFGHPAGRPRKRP